MNLFSNIPLRRWNRTVPRRNANRQVFTYMSVQLTFTSSGGFTGTFLLCKSKRQQPVSKTVLHRTIHSDHVHTCKLKAAYSVLLGLCSRCSRHTVNHSWRAVRQTVTSARRGADSRNPSQDRRGPVPSRLPRRDGDEGEGAQPVPAALDGFNER